MHGTAGNIDSGGNDSTGKIDRSRDNLCTSGEKKNRQDEQESFHLNYDPSLGTLITVH